jgi:hypothetical protein
MTVRKNAPYTKQRWAVLAFVIASAMLLVATATFAAKPIPQVSFVDYAQCVDGTADDLATNCPGGWINGILQASNSTYHEDEVTPQRAELLVPAGAPTTHTMTFTYQARKGSAGVHAYDSLATYNYTQTTADRLQGLNAADQVGGAATTLAIPNDPQVLAPFTSPATGVTSTHQLTGQVMTMFGGTIDSISVPVHDCVVAGKCNDASVDDYATTTITFHVASVPQKVQLLFGGHIASSTGPRGWGPGLGASNISGGPYHIKWTAADGASIGNRDNQIMGSAILTNPTTISTVPSPTSATIGATLQDTATLSPTTATGNVTFSLFRPADATCSGTAAYTETVASSGGSAATVIGFVSDTVGIWHWTASYAGDGVNLPSTSVCADEAVTIGKASPGINTVPSAGGTVGVVILNDTANVTGGHSPTGTVTFNLYSPADPTCAGTPSYTETVGLTAGSATTSNTTAADAAGTWRWVATYNGDANNNTASSGCDDEQVTVAKAQPGISTAQNLLPNDDATLSGLTSGAGGTITFNLFDPSDGTCAGTPAYTSGALTVNGNGTYSTTNTTFLASAEGTWKWQVIYSGDDNNEGATSACGVEAFTIDNDTGS